MIKFLITTVLLSGVFFPWDATGKALRVSISKFYKDRPVLAYSGLISSKSDSVFQELDALIKADLEISGLVSLLSLSREEKRLRHSSKIDFGAWRARGAEFFLEVRLEESLGLPQLVYTIHDVFRKQKIASGRKKGLWKKRRELGHVVTSEILVHLTGKKGLGLTRLAYVSDQKKIKTIYSCDIEGRGIKALVFHKAMALAPHWTPRREGLIYTSYHKINPCLFIKDLSSHRVESISTFPGINVNGKINDQNEVLFTASVDGNPEIYRKHLLTGRVRRLTHHLGVDATPSWSPDNRRIAYVASVLGGTPRIYLMSREGKRAHRLATLGNYHASPVFSPDGRYLVFSSKVHGRFQLMRYDFSSRKTGVLLGRMGDVESPCFSPDGAHIAFSSNRGGKWNIYILDVETSKTFQVTRGQGNCTNPTWA